MSIHGRAGITFFKAEKPEERAAINTFLRRHNQRQEGSTQGYVAYYAATREGDRALLDRLVAAAKFCPLHTPNAAKFFAGDEWRHVYCLQRLAAYHAPENLLSEFVGWCLREMGQDERVHFVSTYADTGTVDPRTGRPHDGGIYRATNAVYCGMTVGRRVEGFIQGGLRHSMRCGSKTWTVRELEAINMQAAMDGKPEPIRLLRSRAMHRYCWPVGATNRERRVRRQVLEARMRQYQFVPVYQPRLLFRRWMEAWDWFRAIWTGTHAARSHPTR